MFKLTLNPSQYAKDHLIRYEDLMSGDHFEANKLKVLDRFKVNATANAFAHMTKMQADIYVFSEAELKEFVKNIRGKG